MPGVDTNRQYKRVAYSTMAIPAERVWWLGPRKSQSGNVSMVELGSLWLFVVPFALAAALPGPAQGALIAQVLSRGGASTLPFVIGMVAGNAVWLLSAIFGLSALAMRFETAFIAVKWLGVAYLLFIAWKLWTANGASQEVPS